MWLRLGILCCRRGSYRGQVVQSESSKTTYAAQEVAAEWGCRQNQRSCPRGQDETASFVQEAHSLLNRLLSPKTVAYAAEDASGDITTFGDRAAARQAFSDNPSMQSAANRFFRGTTSKSQDFQVADLGNRQYQMQFFSPANNPGYGKLYVQTINDSGD